MILEAVSARASESLSLAPSSRRAPAMSEREREKKIVAYPGYDPRPRSFLCSYDVAFIQLGARHLALASLSVFFAAHDER